MKTLYTSSYKRLPKGFAGPIVQISSWGPRAGFKGMLFEPSLVWRHFRNRKEFVGSWKGDYWHQLCDAVETGELQKTIKRIPDKSVLLCWCELCQNCHRGVLTRFLTEAKYAKVIEITPETRPDLFPKQTKALKEKVAVWFDEA